MSKRVDMTGERYGRLVVRSFSHTTRSAHWACVCDCGNETVVSRGNLTLGIVKSCGCYRREVTGPAVGKSTLRHGQSGGGDSSKKTSAYRSWQNMWQRCTNPKATAWHCYGGLGVIVCDRWRDFSNFLADMGERPDGMSLDRHPNPFGNYEPENCRWATRKQQSLNRRDNYTRYRD